MNRPRPALLLLTAATLLAVAAPASAVAGTTAPPATTAGTTAPPATAGISGAPGQHRPGPAYRLARRVPASAMLRAADLGGVIPVPVTGEDLRDLRPPRPCGAALPAAPRGADRTVLAVIGVDDRPTVLVEHVARYRPGGAHRYLRELRRSVRGCAGWAVLATGVAGDESLLLRRRQYVEYAEVDQDTYLVVARTGRALVVLADTGWETADGHRALVRRLSVTAVRRAASVG